MSSQGHWTTLMTILCGLWLPGVLSAQQGTPTKRQLVEVSTVLGNMVLALYNETPLHRDRFIALVENGSYDSLLFHRVVPDFMIEGGEMTSKHLKAGVRVQDTTAQDVLPQEIAPGLIHKHGAMGASPSSNSVDSLTHGSRFFFVLGVPYSPEELEQVAERNTRSGSPYTYTPEEVRTYGTIGGLPRLDGGYTVFGEVVEGLDVLQALERTPRDGWDRPLSDVRMFMRLQK